jgi:hypothetical protein
MTANHHPLGARERTPRQGLQSQPLPLTRLNVRADSYAKQHYQNCHTVLVPNHKFGGEPFTVYFQGKKLSKLTQSTSTMK